ncbi:MAG: hypothetical protein HC821_02465 [Lewinella sp.]|nr:hypothetical protein [Lewinella sp.]
MAAYGLANLPQTNSSTLTQALNNIDAAASASSSAPTVQYLRGIQMAALVNYRSLLDQWLVSGQQSGYFRQDSTHQVQFRAARSALDEATQTYRIKLLGASPGGENDPYYRFWQGKAF